MLSLLVRLDHSTQSKIVAAVVFTAVMTVLFVLALCFPMSGVAAGLYGMFYGNLLNGTAWVLAAGYAFGLTIIASEY